MLVKLFLILTSLALVAPSSAVAAPSGLTITPAKQQITLQTDEPEKRLTVLVTNNTPSSVNLSFSAKDFGGLDDTGGLFFLGSDVNATWDDNRLAKWLTVTPSSATIASRAQQPVQVVIDGGADLAPGGHYAAIVATLASQSDEPVSINQSLASLLFVNKEGGGTAKIELERLQSNSRFWAAPSQASLVIRNTGNTHAIPRGTITFKDPFGRVLSTGILNQTSTVLLPDTKRVLEVDFDSMSPPIWPGIYTLAAQYRFDGSDAKQQEQASYFMIGWVGLGAVALLVAGAGAFWWRRRSGSKLLE